VKVVAIIQARVGSTRLPHKVLIDLGDEPMLARVVERTRRAQALDMVVVATTVQPADNAIAHLCVERDWPCYRGSQEDVLDRYYRAALAYQADVVVRITSDCPLIEPAVVDRVVQGFLDSQPDVDYSCNVLPRRTFPRGLDTEVMRFDVLERAWREDTNPSWREHVTPYIRRNPGLFRIHGIMNDVDLSHMRWTVDTPQDLEFVRRIYDHFADDPFTWLDVISLLDRHPEWLLINRHVEQRVI
jgi:spore coat polysaccharide biosynthesis protein SpsF